MSPATLSFSFISPATPPSGEAETVLCPRLIVSAINPRPLTVYLRMSGFVQNALRNLSHWFQILVAPVSFHIVADLKLIKGVTHERGRFSQERGYFSHARGFFSQGASDD